MNQSKIISIARKRSADPAQEQLRQHKQVWNDAASSLITKMIAFKRAINGRQDPKFNIPTSKIQDPLPHEVGDFLNKLTDEYNQLLHGAESIISEQENYSQHRRVSKPKQQPQLADDGLIVNAGLFDFNDPEKKVIKKLKETVIYAIKRMQNMENHLASMDPANIATALLEMYSYQDAFNFMKKYSKEYCKIKGVDINFDKPNKVLQIDTDVNEKLGFDLNKEIPYIGSVFDVIKKSLPDSDASLYKNLLSEIRKTTGKKDPDIGLLQQAYVKLIDIANSLISDEKFDNFEKLYEYYKSNPPKKSHHSDSDKKLIELIYDDLPYIEPVFDSIKKDLSQPNKKLFMSLFASVKKAFSSKNLVDTNIGAAKDHYKNLLDIAVAATTLKQDSFKNLLSKMDEAPGSESPSTSTPTPPTPPTPPTTPPETPTSPAATPAPESDFNFIKRVESEKNRISTVLLAIRNLDAVDLERRREFISLCKILKTVNLDKLMKLDSDEMLSEISKIRDYYAKALALAKKMLGNPDAKSFHDLSEQVEKIIRSADQDEILTKLSHNMLSRYLKKKMLSLRPIFDSKKKEIRKYRLWTIEAYEETEDVLKNMLTYLKSDSHSPDDLLNHIVEFARALANAIENLLALVGSYVEVSGGELLERRRGDEIEHRTLNMGYAQQVRAFMTNLKNIVNEAAIVARSE